MESSSSSSSSATGSAGTSSSGLPSGNHKRKRKGNIVSAEKEGDTLEDMRARVKAARKKKHKATTVSDNVKRVAAFITWLVLHSLTEVLTPNSDHEHRVKVGSTSYWFNWSKLPLLGDHLCVFLASKWRKLPNGDLIPESYTTLAKFRASVAHFREKSYLEGVSIDTAQLTLYEQKVSSYMSGMERAEAILRQKGVLSAQKGGKAFTVELYRETCKDGNKSPLTPDTIMYLARVIPAAPQKPGKSKRTVVASMNTVGTVRKNMSRANKV